MTGEELSHFANIRKHNLNPVRYLCDVLLAHKW